MIIKFSDYLSIEDCIDYNNLNEPCICPQLYVILQNIKYKTVSYSELLRSPGEDGKFHAIYIWVDYNSGEYYIGKVNRPKISEITRYVGSGTKFKGKYKKNKSRYVRYYLYVCKTEKDTEQIEAQIVNETLIKDPFCLNLVAGGGGISKAPISKYRRDQQSQYMKAHPERYEAMLQAAKNFDRNKILLRNKKIQHTHSQEEYKIAMSNRILKWRKEHPEEYAQARKNNAAAIRNPETQFKRSLKLKEWRDKNPEKYLKAKANLKAALSSSETKEKQSKARKEWIKNNPEKFKIQCAKSHKTQSKPVAMLDINSGKVIKRFNSVQEAGAWVKDNNFTNSINPASSICAVCNKKQIPGHGIKKSAYGFNWEYIKQ